MEFSPMTKDQNQFVSTEQFKKKVKIELDHFSGFCLLHDLIKIGPCSFHPSFWLHNARLLSDYQFDSSHQH